ncbi:MAG: hypothetical protein ABH889_01695 [Candidatus Portnoybacteria bacterium]
MKRNLILDIYNSKNSVFSIKDIALLWGESNAELVKMRLYRYVKAGKLYSIRRGLYAKDKNYNKYELAAKIYTPSYISFETVLGRAGVTFQSYSQIFVASYLSREITADRQAYSYRKIKESVLTNNAGIERKDNYSIASPERSFLDMTYLNKDYYFDNLSVLDWDIVFEILPIYSNKRMEREIKRCQKNT